jgi:hypothetical protein
LPPRRKSERSAGGAGAGKSGGGPATLRHAVHLPPWPAHAYRNELPGVGEEVWQGAVGQSRPSACGARLKRVHLAITTIGPMPEEQGRGPRSPELVICDGSRTPFRPAPPRGAARRCACEAWAQSNAICRAVPLRLAEPRSAPGTGNNPHNQVVPARCTRLKELFPFPNGRDGIMLLCGSNSHFS